jgi:hypothetical protein
VNDRDVTGATLLGTVCLLLLTSALPACAPAQYAEDSANAESNMTRADVEPTAIKLVEAPALAPGKLGVDSWVAYGTLTKDGLGVIAFGVNLDGDTTTVVHLD